MAYWWVAQNYMFKEERSGGPLWGCGHPNWIRTIRPRSLATLPDVQPGDLILSFVKNGIPAKSRRCFRERSRSRNRMCPIDLVLPLVLFVADPEAFDLFDQVVP